MKGVRALPTALVAVEEVPDLDDVALGILDVDGSVAARVLDRPPVLDSRVVEALSYRVQATRRGGEREVVEAREALAIAHLEGQLRDPLDERVGRRHVRNASRSS